MQNAAFAGSRCKVFHVLQKLVNARILITSSELLTHYSRLTLLIARRSEKICGMDICEWRLVCNMTRKHFGTTTAMAYNGSMMISYHCLLTTYILEMIQI